MILRSCRRRFLPVAAVLGAATCVSGLENKKTTPTDAPREETSDMETTAKPAHTNRLIDATSPYLLQHAHNPVDWYEWSDEALERARREDRPIFLSIGYAACHWCHVMEHESFETDEVAAVLNEGFISIKVDREERPDIDSIYMAYTVQTTGHGGWPMSVWLMPDGTPFFAGTYFPQEQFIGLLQQIRQLWTDNRPALIQRTEDARKFLSQWAEGPGPAEGVIDKEHVDATAKMLAGYIDRTHGGFRSGGNKFPPSQAMDLILRVYRRTGTSDLYEVVEVTLNHMARGGIYDHIGGGICRYSTDPQWLVPHFEKMLYDQALVSAIYLDAYQVSKNPLYASVAADIFDYVLSDLQSPEGGFYSSRDADSEGLEGKFYIWTVDEIKAILGDDQGALFCKYFDVTETGNWFEHRGHAPAGPKNILHVTKPPEAFARLHQLDVDELRKKLTSWRRQLAAVRSKRTPPGLDDKVLAAWNGLMIAALAKGARVLDEPRYAQAAARAADFILRKLRTPDGRLLRTYRAGKARLTGYLDDYAFMVDGLLYLYEATFDRRWLDAARELTELSVKHYDDPDGGGFFYTAADSEQLIARSKDPQDGAIPSGNSVHAMNLLRLAILVDRQDYRAEAESILRAFAAMAKQSPSAFERLICAADFYHDRVQEIAIVGELDDAGTKALLRTVYDRYLPNKVVVHASDARDETDIPLLRGRKMIKDRPTAYVCEDYRCQLPVTEPDDLAKQLDRKP
jgi:hypothetical protein